MFSRSHPFPNSGVVTIEHTSEADMTRPYTSADCHKCHQNHSHCLPTLTDRRRPFETQDPRISRICQHGDFGQFTFMLLWPL